MTTDDCLNDEALIAEAVAANLGIREGGELFACYTEDTDLRDVVLDFAHRVLRLAGAQERLAKPQSENAARAEFEQRAYQHYLDRKAAGKTDPTAEGDGTPEALFWKQEDGSYGVLMFNAAWQGFKWGRGLV